jgi:hypothetical protein
MQDNSAETAAEFDASITKLNGEIERMAPNMKAMERWVNSRFQKASRLMMLLVWMTSRQSWRIRKKKLIRLVRNPKVLVINSTMSNDGGTALFQFLASLTPNMSFEVASCSTKPTTTFRSALIKCTKT